MELIQDIGAIAGLAAFVGLAVLALLHFAQARDVRQLRERAAFVPEDGERPAEARAAAARAAARGSATAVAEGGEAAEAAERAAATDPRRAEQLEAQRLAQIAREAAAERRARFERRQVVGGGRLGGRLELPEGRALIVVAIGVLLLGAGVVFGATRILGGDEEPASGGGQAAKGPGVAKEQQAEIAVLNGTDVPGAAADTGAQLKQANYKLGAVTNSETPFDTTVVMYDAGGEETARAVATALGITEVQPIDPEIKGIAEGATVAVVVGADRAGGSAAGSTTDTTAGEL